MGRNLRERARQRKQQRIDGDPEHGSSVKRRGDGAPSGPAHSRRGEGDPANQRRRGGPSRGNRANHSMFPMKGQR
ncbi:MAG TPA: hypothetical protein VLB73_04845 [Patescibacteria group bacterium]|nr:hypothetical protein [Patescibacteria group bacterium]